jgi:hypothetical protein
MIKRPTRPLLLGAFVTIALVAGAVALVSRQSVATPVTVYLTPT